LRTRGVYFIDDEEARIKALQWLKIDDVWGIGKQYAKKLRAHGVNNAYEFTSLNDRWVKSNLSSVGLKLMMDLRGESCLELDKVKEKKSISVTRTFDYAKEDIEDIRERVSTFACKCAEKLRKQNSLCSRLQVFIITNYFRKDSAQYSNSINIKLPYPTNSSIDISKFAIMGLENIFRKGYRYKKSGVILMDFEPEGFQQLSIFESMSPMHTKLMKVMDKLNCQYSGDVVRLASQSSGKTWKMRQNYISQRYTTNINEIIEVKV